MRFKFFSCLLLLMVVAGCTSTKTEDRLADKEDHPPVPISMPVPQYPRDLRKAGIEGTVIVEFVIGKDGEVKEAKIVRSPNPGFDTPALAAAMRWRFHPGVKAGRPVNSRVQVPIYFALDYKASPAL